MIYRFKTTQVLRVNNSPNRLAIPVGSECIVVSEDVPEYYVLRMVTPAYLNRFTVRLPRNMFEQLSPIKNYRPNAIYVQPKRSTGTPVESVEPVTAGLKLPGRQITFPDLLLGEWYIVEGFEYSMVRLDNYDHGLYYMTAVNALGKWINIKVDENELRKYKIRPALETDFPMACPSGQCSLKTKQVVKVGAAIGVRIRSFSARLKPDRSS